jgi:hypothetical protein
MSISERTIYNVLQGKKCPKMNEMEEFARALKVPIEFLYESDNSLRFANSCNYWSKSLKNKE